MKPTVYEIAQRVMHDPRYQDPPVKSDFVALLGKVGELLGIAEDTEGLRALVNQLKITQENWPEPQYWAVAWLDRHGQEQREFFPADQRHVAVTLYDRLEATGIKTIEMSQIFLTREKKEDE